MSVNEPIVELDARFSSPEASPRPWPEVVDVIRSAEIFWLSTVRGDGRPHVTPLPAMWLDGAMHFCTGPGEQKAHNLRSNPACVLTTGTNALSSGLDVIAEGKAVRVTELPLLRRLAQMWREKLDWRFHATDGGFTDHAAGVTAQVFAVAPDKILAFGKGEPFSQTRYRFPGLAAE